MSDKYSTGNVWLWKDPDVRWKKDVVQYIEALEPVDKEMILLHCSNVCGFESVSLTNYILSICYKFGIFGEGKIMFLNSKDLTLCIELCLKKMRNQNNNVENDVTDEDIINCHSAYVNSYFTSDSSSDKTLLLLKDFLKKNNLSDSYLMYDKISKFEDPNENILSYFSTYKFLILGTPQSEVVKKLITTIVGRKDLFNIMVETPLNISLCGSPGNSPTSSPPRINVTAESLNCEDIPVETTSDSEPGSATEEYSMEVIIAFLSLLVNSRNELALSKSMISPIIDFSHEAFTKLRHLAVEKEMPMCQVALSYVTRIRLGGKSYAPATDCPMLNHLKSLEVFVDILNQLQTVIEEDTKPESAVKKLINSLKKKLLKCGSDKLKENSINTAANSLIVSFHNMPSLVKCKDTSSAPQICQDTLDLLYSFVNYFNCNFWTFDAEKILCKRQSKRTPLNLPPLLGYFRSPEDDCSTDSVRTLNEDITSQNSIIVPSAQLSYFHHSDSSSMSTPGIDYSTPSKMNFKGCLDSKPKEAAKNNENFLSNNISKKVQTKSVSKIRKRSILAEITNDDNCMTDAKHDDLKQKKKKSKNEMKSETEPKESIKVPTVRNIPKKNIKKIPKKLKLVPGQVKITNFFIAGKNA